MALREPNDCYPQELKKLRDRLTFLACACPKDLPGPHLDRSNIFPWEIKEVLQHHEKIRNETQPRLSELQEMRLPLCEVDIVSIMKHTGLPKDEARKFKRLLRATQRRIVLVRESYQKVLHQNIQSVQEGTVRLNNSRLPWGLSLTRLAHSLGPFLRERLETEKKIREKTSAYEEASRVLQECFSWWSKEPLSGYLIEEILRQSIQKVNAFVGVDELEMVKQKQNERIEALRVYYEIVQQIEIGLSYLKVLLDRTTFLTNNPRYHVYVQRVGEKEELRRCLVERTVVPEVLISLIEKYV